MLQIDDPDLPDGWQMFPDMCVRITARTRSSVPMRLTMRCATSDRAGQLHVCWGSFHGPHQNDIPLEDIIDIVFGVTRAVFDRGLEPDARTRVAVFERRSSRIAVLVPGVVGHCTDFIEHPELVAQRLERYAQFVGRDKVIAGTDCGIGPRVGHAKIAWAKLSAI